jgi:hypothetical protein
VRKLVANKTERPLCLGAISTLSYTSKGNLRGEDPVVSGCLRFTCKNKVYEVRQENGGCSSPHFAPYLVLKGVTEFVNGFVGGGTLSSIVGLLANTVL